MVLLAIDTAHPHDQMVGLIKLISSRGQNGKMIGKKIWKGKWDESKTVLPHIVTLLKKNRLTFRNLSGIVVHRGPGSFSSVRIGVTIANSLAYALGIPVYGVSCSLKVPRLTPEQGLATLIPPARIDFCQKFPKSMKAKQVVAPLYTHAAHISKSSGLWHKISSKR